MPGSPIAIGPFVGGMNTYSDPAAIGDNEAVRIINFDVDLDGSLVSRPAILEISQSGGSGFGFKIIIVASLPTGTFLIGHTTSNTYAYEVNTGIFQNIADYPLVAAALYDNKVWLVSNEDLNDSGWWSPGGPLTAVPDMPTGVTAVVYKERLFIGTENSRIYFSNAGNLPVWDPSDFFDARSGDTQQLVKLLSLSGQIVIFKTESTHTFAYDSSPARGTVQEVSSSVGADNTDCVVEQDGTIYVYHNQSVYAINNWRWEQINNKMVFEDSIANMPTEYTERYTLSILGYRLVVRFGTKLYVYGLKTRTWSLWTTTFFPQRWYKLPEKDDNGLDVYFSGGYNKTERRVYSFQDRHDRIFSASLETFRCEIASKLYDYSIPYSFKRLFWWGVDIVTPVTIDAVIYPEVFNKAVTWAEVTAAGVTWNSGTIWGRPLDRNINVSDSATPALISGARTLIRYLKAIRFRKIMFEVSGNSLGTPETSPIRVLSMVAVVSNKQLMPKKIN